MFVCFWSWDYLQTSQGHYSRFGIVKKIYHLGFISGFTRFHLNYRTYSHAGFPKGSYLIPNPTHFHIACEKHIALSRPQLTTITRRLPIHNSSNGKKNTRVVINFDDHNSVSLNMPLETVKSFILPIAKAFDLKTVPPLTTKGSQTSYLTPSNLNCNKVTYTPLFVDSYKTCQSEEESLEKTRIHEKRFLENLHHEIEMTDFTSESSDSEMSNIPTNDVDDKNNDEVVTGAGDCFYSLNEIGIQDMDGNRLSIQEIAFTLSKVVKGYLNTLYSQLDLFSSDERVGNSCTLINNMFSCFKKLGLDNLNREEMNDLRLSIIDYTFKLLECDSERDFNRAFSLSEILNKILNNFCSIVETFQSTTSTASSNVMYQSTPRNEKKLDEKGINSFKKKISLKSGAESYWITLNNLSSSQHETSFGSNYARADTTARDLLKNDNSSTPRDTIDEDYFADCDSFKKGINLKAALDSASTSQSEISFYAGNDKTSRNLFKNHQSSTSGNDIFEDYFANCDCVSEGSNSSEEETCFNKSETTILRNSTNFIRSDILNNRSYSKESCVTFVLSGADSDMEDKENKVDTDDSGNWMGYTNAKF